MPNKPAIINIGEIYYNNKFGPFQIIEDLGIINHKHYLKIRFMVLNMFGFYTERVVQYSAIIRKDGPHITDPYMPRLYGVACNGNMYGKCHDSNGSTREYALWTNMILRCYNPNTQNYPYYGGRGITVCHKWLCFEYFYNDLPCIPNYDLWINGIPGEYELDKDILQSNIPDNMKVYAPETVMFVSSMINKVEMNKRKDTNTSGYIGIKRICDKYQVTIGKNYFGTFRDPKIAAAEYNYVARRMGYPDEYLNKVPDIDHITIMRCRLRTSRINGKIEPIKVII